MSPLILTITTVVALMIVVPFLLAFYTAVCIKTALKVTRDFFNGN